MNIMSYMIFIIKILETKETLLCKIYHSDIDIPAALD